MPERFISSYGDDARRRNANIRVRKLETISERFCGRNPNRGSAWVGDEGLSRATRPGSDHSNGLRIDGDRDCPVRRKKLRLVGSDVEPVAASRISG